MNFYEKNNLRKKRPTYNRSYSFLCVKNNYGIGPFHPIPGF